MKRSTFHLAFAAAACLLLSASHSIARSDAEIWAELDTKPVPEWWRDGKFGIFIHWGVYSVPAWCDGWYAEWYYKLMQKAPVGSATLVEHHQETWGKDFRYPQFAPMFRAEKYDPAAWAALFKNSGARYVVLTSKHHDGYCLWDAPDSGEWNAVKTGPESDLIAPLATAVREQGLKFGLYYSLLEWDHGDQLPGNRHAAGSDEYVTEHVLPQLKDLVKKYEPSILWSDGEWDQPASYWRSAEILDWYTNRPENRGEVVWNDRWGKKTRGKHGAFYTTEYGKDGKEGGAHPWEENRGIGGSYGYNTWYEDKLEKYPSSQELLDVFVGTISRGGNFLLNVGPRSDGTIMDLFQQRLSDIGRFLKTNGEAVYGSRLAHKSDEKEKIKYTRSGDGRFHYAFVKGRPGDVLSLSGVHLREGQEVVLLADPEKRPLSWTQDDKGLTISGISRVSQHGEFYWVFRLPGGFHDEPADVN